MSENITTSTDILLADADRIAELERLLAEAEVKSEKFEEFKFKFTAAVDSIYKTAQPLFELYHEINSQVPEVKGE